MRLILVIGLISAACIAQAKQPLKEVSSVWNGLLNIGIASEIGEYCPNIAPRTARGLLRLNSIRNEAKALGYSNDEIEAFRTSASNKAQMRAEGEAYMASKGVVKGQNETYCALGKAEMASSSAIGSLLKAR